jgi:hypothetical protein
LKGGRVNNIVTARNNRPKPYFRTDMSIHEFG